MLNLVIVAVIVGIIFFLRRGVVKPSFYKLGLNFGNTNWLRPLLTFGVVGLIFYIIFFTGFMVKVVEWNWANTPLGGKMEEKWGTGASWLLWLGIAVIAATLWKKFDSKKSSQAKAEPVPLIDQFFVLVISLVAGTVVLAVTWIVLSLFGLVEGIETMFQGSEGRKGGMVAECTTNETSLDFRIDTGGRDVTICRDGNSFFLLPMYGHNLKFEISPKFLRENEHLLKNRSLEDFANIQQPRTFLGSTQESYKISPISSIENQYVSAFDRSGLDRIIVTVRAVK